MSWIRDTFFGGAEKDAGGRAAETAVRTSEDQARAIEEASQQLTPSIDEAAKIRAEAAQAAADLELAGLGEAKDLYNGIIDQTLDQAKSLRDNSYIQIRDGGSRQREALLKAYGVAQKKYKEKFDMARSALGSGFDAANAALDKQYASAEEGFMKAMNDGKAILDQQKEEGLEALGGFEAGKEAFRLQLVMTGALGEDAQKQFYESYQQSPATIYQLEQAAKLSGASGGTKLARLQEMGLGIVAQDLDNHFNKLGSLAERSQREGENKAGFISNLSPQYTSIANNTAAGLSNIRTGLGDAKSGLAQSNAAQNASIAAQEAEAFGTLAEQTGRDYGVSLANESSELARIDQNLIPVLSDFQKQRAAATTAFAGLESDITSGLSRDLGAIEAERIENQASLKAGTITGKAGLLAQGQIDATDAYNAGRIGGSDVTRGTVTDVAKLIGGLNG